MKKSEVIIGAIYAKRVSEKIVPVKIMKRHLPSVLKFGRHEVVQHGWDAINMITNREVYVKSAASLRYRVVENMQGEKRTFSRVSNDYVDVSTLD